MMTLPLQLPVPFDFRRPSPPNQRWGFVFPDKFHNIYQSHRGFPSYRLGSTHQQRSMAESNRINTSDDEPKVSFDDLKSIYCVHACYGWPTGKPGRLVPAVIADSDKGKIKKGQPLTGLVGWKSTIHFSMGGLLPDGPDAALSDRRRAIILPLSSLLPLATTIHTDDIVVVGEFTVPDGAIIVTPGDATDDAWVKGGKYTHVKMARTNFSKV